MVSSGGAGDPMNGGSGVVSLLCPEHPTGLQPCGLDSWQFRRLVPRDDLGLERRHGQSHTTTTIYMSGTERNDSWPQFYLRTSLYSRKPSVANNDAWLCHKLTITYIVAVAVPGAQCH